LFRQATEAVDRAQRLATIHRKDRKREYRRLWITRINAAVRSEGMTYSRFMEGLTKAGIEVNRKMLSEVAIADAEGFKALIEKARAALA
jgi:large subunit ribosomal protein L20